MIALAPFLLLLAGDPPAGAAWRVELAQLTIRQRMIVRVPARAAAPAPRTTWKEKKGPRCTTMDEVAGAVVSGRDSVDLILRGGGRLRAEFAASCPALSYYSGFYILPTDDRRICADRDSIHDRSGGECAIDRFRRLVPVAAPPPPPAMPPIQRVRSERRPAP